MDSGCDITLVPKDLIKLFRSIEVKPTTQQIWAANNTPISVEGEVELPFFLDEELSHAPTSQVPRIHE